MQPEPLYVLRGHRAAVQALAFTPGAAALAAGCAQRRPGSSCCCIRKA